MHDANLIQWLANGPFLLFAFAIGLVVSIDVSVVELTRDYEDDRATGEGPWTIRMRWMLVWHALFHAGSFWLYTVVIYGLQFIVFIPIDFLDLPPGVSIGLLTLINFVIVCFIWWTYRGKIQEDHSDKADDSRAIGRRDMQLLVNLVRVVAHRVGLGERARGVAIAGTVAVDMLAMSALLKTFLLPNANEPPISQLTGVVLIDITVFAAVILCTVALVVLLAHALGHLLRSSFKLVVALRLAEPLIVFYLLAGAVRTVMNLSPETRSALGGNQFAIDFSFSCLLVLSLVIANGMGWRELTAIYSRRSSDANSHNPLITLRDVTVGGKTPLLTLGVAVLVFIVVIGTMWFAYATAPGIGTHNHLIEATEYFAWFVLGATIFYLYTPSTRLDSSETTETQAIGASAEVHQFDCWMLVIGVALGLFALNCFNFVVFGSSSEVDAILLWSIYLLSTWFLFDLRRLRFYRAQRAGATNRRVNDADFAELVSTVGVTSSLVALVATKIVSQLIS